MKKAMVFSIEEFATYDGPGIRTTVFLKGCPLRCEWCHNPEGQSTKNQIIKSQNGCTGCGRCVKEARFVGKRIEYTERSIEVCPNRLLRYCGVWYTSEELVDKIGENADILNASGGGITFSGGEPLSQHEFLFECLKRLKNKTSRAIQTSGYCDSDVFKKILSETDYVLYDIKLVDEDAHIRYTGVSNKKILDNFKILVESGKEFVVRTPLIPGVTDTVENLNGIATLLAENQVSYIELLPYNSFAGGKYASVGMEYHPSFDEGLRPQPHIDIFEEKSIQVKIM
ncbi:MAG: glycyl-radical enzyme activating protein [Lachnospiraceae bacterium]|nr:glycyl-radical enzyme activating protein [Lachnospiraceae bacterium]